MIYIGIDYSINSPACCININNKKLFYYNKYKITKKITAKEQQAFDVLATVDTVKIDFQKIHEKITDYSDRELSNIKEATERSDDFLNFLFKYTHKDDNVIIGIEGFSYGSNSNRQIELGGFQYILRYKLLQNGFNFKIFSPKTIKAVAGKGTFGKNEMVNAYINDKRIENDALRNSIVNNFKKYYINNKNWVKPLDDIIDAYWAMRCIESRI